MTTSPSDDARPWRLPRGRRDFPTTHWTLVMRAREGSESRRIALEELCGLYWYPVYVFLRGKGHPRHDAEDLTQGFFVKLLRDGTFEAAQSEKGRLRSFLLSSLERHVADQRRLGGALKRGAAYEILAFEDLGAEERYQAEPVDYRDPERLFARAWTHRLLEGVRDRLKEHFEETGRAGVFEALLPFLILDGPPPSYHEVAERLDASETAVRLLVFRMRSRFRDLLREEVERTVGGPEEVEDELEWIRSSLAQ